MSSCDTSLHSRSLCGSRQQNRNACPLVEPNLDFPKQDYEQQFFMLKVFVIGGIGTVLGTLVRSFSALEDERICLQKLAIQTLSLSVTVTLTQ